MLDALHPGFQGFKILGTQILFLVPALTTLYNNDCNLFLFPGVVSYYMECPTGKHNPFQKVSLQCKTYMYLLLSVVELEPIKMLISPLKMLKISKKNFLLVCWQSPEKCGKSFDCVFDPNESGMHIFLFYSWSVRISVNCASCGNNCTLEISWGKGIVTGTYASKLVTSYHVN